MTTTNRRAVYGSLVRMCYEHSLLHARRAAHAVLKDHEERRLHELSLLLSPKGYEDERRRHRRFVVRLAAEVRLGSRTHRAVLLDVSPAGLKLALEAGLHSEVEQQLGADVNVRLTAHGSTYAFGGKLLRVESPCGAFRTVVVQIHGVPLELRALREAA